MSTRLLVFQRFLESPRCMRSSSSINIGYSDIRERYFYLSVASVSTKDYRVNPSELELDFFPSSLSRCARYNLYISRRMRFFPKYSWTIRPRRDKSLATHAHDASAQRAHARCWLILNAASVNASPSLWSAKVQSMNNF